MMWFTIFTMFMMWFLAGILLLPRKSPYKGRFETEFFSTENHVLIKPPHVNES